MDFLQLEWGRCIDGYAARHVGQRQALGEWEIEARTERFETYKPTEFPVLFQTFADTDSGDIDAIVRFTDRFGVIGGGARYDLRFRPPGTPLALPGGYMFNTTEDEFRRHQNTMREALTAWENDNWSEVIRLFNEVEFGRGHIRPRLGNHKLGVELLFVPTNLIEFMWLQFALFMASQAKLFRCERCNTPFLVGSGTGRRETAKFCSNACRVAVFRNRAEAANA